MASDVSVVQVLKNKTFTRVFFSWFLMKTIGNAIHTRAIGSIGSFWRKLGNSMAKMLCVHFNRPEYELYS